MTGKYVFTVEQAIELLTKNPEEFKVIYNAQAKSFAAGSKFYRAKLQGKDFIVSVKDVEVSRGVSNPDDKNDKRNDTSGKMRLKIETTISRSGKYGEMMILLNKVFKERMAEFITTAGLSPQKTTISDVIQTVMSDTSKTPGAKIDDPIIRNGFDLEKEVQGEKETRLQEAIPTGVDSTGKKTYDIIAPVVDGVAVNNRNIYKLVCDGSVLVSARVHFDSVSLVKGNLALKSHIQTANVLRGAPGKFADDDDYKLTSEKTTQPTVKTSSNANADNTKDTFIGFDNDKSVNDAMRMIGST